MARQRGSFWQAEFRLPDGKRERPGGFKSEAAALLWEAQARAAVEAGELLPPTPNGKSIRLQASTLSASTGKTLDQIRDALLAADAPEGWAGTKDLRSAEARSKVVVDFFGADAQIGTIDVHEIKRFTEALKSKGNSGGTINRKVAALSKMLTYAGKYGYLTKARPHISRVKENKTGRLRWLTVDEEARLLGMFTAMEQHDLRHVLIFLVDTGARVSEMLNLAWRNVTKESGKPSVTFVDTKNGDTRTVPLTTRAFQALAHFKGRDKVKPFASVDYWNLRYLFDRARTRLGEDFDDVVLHTLRHTCASRLVQRGIDLRRVKDWLGHADFKTTLRYAKLAPGDLLSAVSVLEQPLPAPAAAPGATDAHP